MKVSLISHTVFCSTEKKKRAKCQYLVVDIHRKDVFVWYKLKVTFFMLLIICWITTLFSLYNHCQLYKTHTLNSLAWLPEAANSADTKKSQIFLSKSFIFYLNLKSFWSPWVYLWHSVGAAINNYFHYQVIFQLLLLVNWLSVWSLKSIPKNRCVKIACFILPNSLKIYPVYYYLWQKQASNPHT